MLWYVSVLCLSADLLFIDVAYALTTRLMRSVEAGTSGLAPNVDGLHFARRDATDVHHPASSDRRGTSGRQQRQCSNPCRSLAV